MIIQCESCSRKFIVNETAIPKEGRTVQCGYCSVSWHQMPVSVKIKEKKEPKVTELDKESDESPSVEKIKASDGKNYRFLGNQWAELLPSGKTGLFARKKISQELDQITGRKRNVVKKKRKKSKTVDPSESLDTNKKLPDTYKSKQGLGFFGYIFLIIVIGFSLVGVLKTFEKDLVNYFPETELIFMLFNEQLDFLAESVKNIIVIIKDLINSY